MAAGVPTIWIGMLQLLDKDPGAYDLSACNRIVCGGSAVPMALIEGLQRHDLNIIQAWGMTETSPVGIVCPAPLEVPEMSVEDPNAPAAPSRAPVPASTSVCWIETGEAFPGTA